MGLKRIGLYKEMALVCKQRMSCSSRGGFQWRILFHIAMWSIWKCKNQCVFNGKSHNPRLAACIRDQAVKFLFYATPPRQSVCNVIKRIRWDLGEASNWLEEA